MYIAVIVPIFKIAKHQKQTKGPSTENGCINCVESYNENTVAIKR